jgi:hypothetical protein
MVSVPPAIGASTNRNWSKQGSHRWPISSVAIRSNWRGIWPRRGDPIGRRISREEPIRTRRPKRAQRSRCFRRQPAGSALPWTRHGYDGGGAGQRPEDRADGPSRLEIQILAGQTSETRVVAYAAGSTSAEAGFNILVNRNRAVADRRALIANMSGNQLRSTRFYPGRVLRCCAEGLPTMTKPSAFEMSRRNLLIGTATSVAVGTTARTAKTQDCGWHFCSCGGNACHGRSFH